MNAASIFGRTIPNFIADSYGPFNGQLFQTQSAFPTDQIYLTSIVVIPMSFVSGVLMFAMFGAGSQGGMIVFAILYGFFSGGGWRIQHSSV